MMNLTNIEWSMNIEYRMVNDRSGEKLYTCTH